jgi:hypothetical protein
VGLRPEFIDIGPPEAQDGGLLGQVVWNQLLGGTMLYQVDIAGLPIQAVTASTEAFGAGAKVSVRLDTRRAFLFDDETEEALLPGGQETSAQVVTGPQFE